MHLSPKDPAFRAAWTKFAVQAVNQSPRREAMRRLIGEPTLARVRAASMLDWLPFTEHLRVVQAVYDTLGLHEARAFWRERLLRSFETKLMAPMATGSTLVFGHRLYACFKMGIYAYRLIARDAGELIVSQDGDGGVAITFSELPPEVVESHGWHALCHGQCEAVVEYTRFRTCEIIVSDTTARGYRYRIRAR